MSKKEDTIPTWTTATKKVVADNPYLTLEEHRREEEGTGKHGNFFIVHAPNWANIVAITEDDKVLLIEQYRQGSERVELEIPGGIIGEHEEPDLSILRELVEETGYEPTEKSEFRRIGEVLPNPAFMQNKCFTYLLTDVRLTSKTNFDELEHIRVRLVPRSQIEQLIVNGEIQHSLVIAALYWMKLAGY